MSIRIGINGFGRIGRYLIRLLNRDADVEVVAVNARADNPQMAHLLKYDSVHGHFPGEVQATQEGLSIDGRPIRITRYGAGEWTWGELGCDLVSSPQASSTTARNCEKHLACVVQDRGHQRPGQGRGQHRGHGLQPPPAPARAQDHLQPSCTTNCLPRGQGPARVHSA
jgi:glyceraldehyde 3-phosphate dehydrogenase